MSSSNIDLQIEQRFDHILNELNEEADHPDWVEGHIEYSEDPVDDNQSYEELQEDISNIISNIESGNNNASFEDENGSIQFTPVKRIVKSKVLPDFIPSLSVDRNVTGFRDRLQQLANMFTARLAVNSNKLREYAERNYLMYYEELKSDPLFLQYQPTPFPIKKYTFLTYIWSMRVQVGYSYKTVRDTLANSLANHMRDTNRGNPKLEYGAAITHLIRALLRKYGNEVFKVAPLLNKDMKSWTSKLNLYVESDARLNAFIKYGRAGGQRTDTYHFAKLGHVHWYLQNDRIATIFEIWKDKILLSESRQQTIYGCEEINSCPNKALLWYLAHIRQVFKVGDYKDVLSSGDFTLKEGYEHHPLFSKLGSNDVCPPKNLSNAMKISAKLHLKKRYTPRSLRSGCICQFLINSIKQRATIDTSDYAAIKTHIGWQNEKSVLFYHRAALVRYQHIQSMLDPTLFEDPRGEVMNLINSTMDESSSVAESSQSTLASPIKRRKSPAHPKYILTSVRKLKVPRDMREYIINRHPDLKRAIDKDKSKKDHAWTTFWQGKLLEHASSLTAQLEQIPDYLASQRALKSVKSDRRARNSPKNKISSIRKAVAQNDLIDKWNNKDTSFIDLPVTIQERCASSQETERRQLRKRKQVCYTERSDSPIESSSDNEEVQPSKMAKKSGSKLPDARIVYTPTQK